VSTADRVRWLLRGLGELLVTAGVVVLLFCVYELSITGLYTHQEQKKLDKTLSRQWAAPRPAASPGTALAPYDEGAGIARIYLPSLGRDQVHVVVEGVSHEDLKKGPGHMPGTGLPGAIGNVVISGHRTTYGAPFNRLDELKVGDPIVLETRDFFYTYRVIRRQIVQPSAIEVTYPVPDRPGVLPTQRLLTLTTCNPKYSARQRLVVTAVLAEPLAKGPGVLPPALTGRL
jgi:sortase A